MASQPLEGLKVVDIAVLFAAPTISQNMGDFGAEVIKVEHPKMGDSLRSLGATKDGIPCGGRSPIGIKNVLRSI